MPKKGAYKKAPPPPAFLLCDEDDAAGLRTLLSEQPSALEQRNADGWTPLMMASYAGSEECASLLLQVGADVRAVCKDGDTALHYASAQGHMDIIRMLAKAGALLECEDEDEDTPAAVAQNKKTRQLIEALIAERNEGGADGEGGEGVTEEGEGGEEEASAAAGGGGGGGGGGRARSGKR